MGDSETAVMLVTVVVTLFAFASARLPPVRENTIEDEATPGKYIIGGDFVRSLGKWPSMCSLQLGHDHFCGASLISNDTVVTAAHCLLNYPIELFVVVCGSVVNKNMRDEGFSHGDWEAHPLREWKIHKQYERSFESGFPNDIALIKLEH